MQKLKKLIELTISGKSQRSISSMLGIHRHTIDNYQAFLKKHSNGDLSTLISLSEEELDKFVKTDEDPSTKDNLFALFPEYEKRLAKVGVNKHFIWEEFCRQGASLSYSRFCRLFKEWEGSKKVTLHMEHKAGDKMFIDYAGNKLHLTDPDSGLKSQVEVFIAVLGYSQFTYCQASYSQKKVDFLSAIANCLTFFGGVPQAIVPDNLKAAVNKASRYEPDINESLIDFAEHYQTHIYPTRSYRPKDKALVEKTVSILYTRIYAVLADKVFYSLNALNEAIRELLLVHNQTLFQGKTDSRQTRFNEVERQTLMALPTSRYELKSYRQAKVHPDCHVKIMEDKHYYSVPHKYVGQVVKIRYSLEVVEIYSQYQRIAIHKRSPKIGAHTTNVDHLPAKHQWIVNWSPEYFINRAEKVGENTVKAIKQVLYAKKYPEQAYRVCAGILALLKNEKIGGQRLENACERALAFDYVSLKNIKGILDTGLDTTPIYQEENTKIIPLHANIRGSSNYQ